MKNRDILPSYLSRSLKGSEREIKKSKEERVLDTCRLILTSLEVQSNELHISSGLYSRGKGLCKHYLDLVLELPQIDALNYLFHYYKLSYQQRLETIQPKALITKQKILQYHHATNTPSKNNNYLVSSLCASFSICLKGVFYSWIV